MSGNHVDRGGGTMKTDNIAIRVLILLSKIRIKTKLIFTIIYNTIPIKGKINKIYDYMAGIQA